jgi:hypothetical protein
VPASTDRAWGLTSFEARDFLALAKLAKLANLAKVLKVLKVVKVVNF